MVTPEYKIPLTLKAGGKHDWMENKKDGSRVSSAVIFLSYSSAPVFVYVRDSADQTLCVLREELFEKDGSLE